MTEREKMLAGKMYNPADETLAARRLLAHRLCAQYNASFEEDEELRADILRQLLPCAAEDAYLLGPIYFDYGDNTTLGRRFFANFNLTVLDCCPVTVGDDVLFGPNVSLMTPLHPLRWQDRNLRPGPDGEPYALEYARPVVIQDNCWLGSNVTVIGGVTIGAGCVIGAGSVVTRDIPPGMLAAGNPCRVLRPVTEADAVERQSGLF